MFNLHKKKSLMKKTEIEDRKYNGFAAFQTSVIENEITVTIWTHSKKIFSMKNTYW